MDDILNDEDLKDSGKKDMTNGIILSIVVVLIWGISAIVVYKVQPDWVTRGQFGDMFGGINSLFSGLAFAGLIYTIILQRKELTLQRKELILTRNELMRSAKAQEESSSALTAQLKSMAIAANINGLTTIIDYYKTVSVKSTHPLKRAQAEQKITSAINDIAEYMDDINSDLKDRYKDID